jgi:hypothetical protein
MQAHESTAIRARCAYSTSASSLASTSWRLRNESHAHSPFGTDAYHEEQSP